MTRPLRLMTVAPGHFHAALVQRAMLPGVHPKAYVYAPLDADTVRHLAHVAYFNGRPTDPTRWELDVRTGADYFARFLRELPGAVAVFAGRNKAKAAQVLATVAACGHVFVDKPWVIEAEDFPKLEQTFREADLREVVVGDLMTERHEVATLLQRELMRDPAIFGQPVAGTADDPGLAIESTHYLRKTVDGVPVRRPDWWFDVRQAGDGLADVGTHLADLAMWLLAPDQGIDFRRDVQVLDASRWATAVEPDQFHALTGSGFDPHLHGPWVRDGRFHYYGNGTVSYRLRGVHVRLTVLWDVDPPPTAAREPHAAVARGTRSTVSVAPGTDNEPELVVAPNAGVAAEVRDAVEGLCRDWQTDLPGVAAREAKGTIRVVIPPALRRSHADHFTAALREFVRYVQFPRSVPAWERPNLLAKYFVTTTAVEIARRKTGGA
jgi:predicted dehydrogenase